MDKSQILQRANAMCQNTLMAAIGISFTDIGDDFVEATMPVEPRVHQPFGLLHGGAICALAESLGSLGSQVLIEDPKAQVVGIEINANHLKSTRSGTVKARGQLIHKGSKTHVWDIRVYHQDGQLISICRLTNMILVKP